MTSEINIQSFASQLRDKRGNRGLRDVAKEIGNVSASTLSRIEKGNVPDLDTFIRICKWLDISPDRFVASNRQEDNNEDGSRDFDIEKTDIEAGVQTITVHLRADKTLDSKTAAALTHLVQMAYNAIEQGVVEEDSE